MGGRNIDLYVSHIGVGGLQKASALNESILTIQLGCGADTAALCFMEAMLADIRRGQSLRLENHLALHVPDWVVKQYPYESERL